MAGRVIQAVLRLRDDMSGGLLAVARNAQRAGASITSDMTEATRKVLAFKNKFVSALSETAKNAVKLSATVGVALVGGLLAMDGATEEYRVAQGKLQTAFEAAGLGAEAAQKAYAGFYDILGDTDTATEASQLLARLTRNTEDISTWTRIAAGIAGTYGDSLPIEGLIESCNETVKVGQVTGSLADALNWAGLSEDDFNAQLEACSSEAERNLLVMDTLTQTYNTAADAFYKNNRAIITARANQRALMSVMAGLGQTAAGLKNSMATLLGMDGKGGFRVGSVLDFMAQKAEQLNTAFQRWQQSGVIDVLSQKLDTVFAIAVQKVGQAMQFLQAHSQQILAVIKSIGAALAAVKLAGFAAKVLEVIHTLSDFGAMLGTLAQHGAYQLGAMLGRLSTLLGGISLGPTVAIVAAAIGALIAAGVLLYKNWDTVKAKALELGRAFLTNISPAVDIVKAGISQLAGFITSTVVPAALSLFQTAKQVAGALRDAFAPAASIVLQIASQLADFFIDSVVPAFVAIIDIVGQLAGAFLKIAAPAIQVVLAIISALAGFLTSTVIPAVGSVISIVAALASKFLSVALPAVSKVLDILKRLANFLTGLFLSGMNKAIDVVSRLAGFFGQKLQPAIDAVKGAFERVRSAVSGVIETIKTFLGMDTSKTIHCKTVYDNAAPAGANAQGTGFWRGGLTWINERGGEIIRLPDRKTIVPRDVVKMPASTVRYPGDALAEGRKTLVDLPRGTKIIPHTESVRLMQNSLAVSALSQTFRDGSRYLTQNQNTFIQNIGRNAYGSSYWRGGPTWINERGGEIIQLPGAQVILPNPAPVQPVQPASIAIAPLTSHTSNANTQISTVLSHARRMQQTQISNLISNLAPLTQQTRVSNVSNLISNFAPLSQLAQNTQNTQLSEISSLTRNTQNTQQTQVSNLISNLAPLVLLSRLASVPAQRAPLTRNTQTSNILLDSSSFTRNTQNTKISNLISNRSPLALFSQLAPMTQLAQFAQNKQISNYVSQFSPQNTQITDVSPLSHNTQIRQMQMQTTVNRYTTAAPTQDIHIDVRVDTMIGEKKFAESMGQQIAQKIIRALQVSRGV